MLQKYKGMGGLVNVSWYTICIGNNSEGGKGRPAKVKFKGTFGRTLFAVSLDPVCRSQVDTEGHNLFAVRPSRAHL